MKLPYDSAIKVAHTTPIDRVRGLLCCAFEGGSNYWIDAISPNYPAHTHALDYGVGGSMQPAHEVGPGYQYWHWSQLLPTTGGSVDVYVTDEITNIHTLDLTRIRTGLQLLADWHPKHFADMLTGNDDATTGDVFLQLCLFGEVIYG